MSESEFRGLNHDFHPDQTLSLNLKMMLFKFKGTKLGLFPQRSPLRLQMWRDGGRSSEKDQASVTLMGTEYEESTMKDEEKFTEEGRIMDCEKS